MAAPASHAEAPTRPWYLGTTALAILWVLSAGAFSIATVNEIRATRSALSALTAGYAEQVHRVVVESQRYAVAVYGAWEKQVGNHLVTLAVLGDQLARAGDASPALLDSIAAANDLACFTIRRGDGRVLAAGLHANDDSGKGRCWNDVDQANVASLPPGGTTLLQATAADAGGYRLIGIRKRADGGVVCAGMDARALLQARRKFGPGRLLQSLGEHAGTAYLALQDTFGIIAATRGVERLSAVDGDSVLWAVMTTGETVTRTNTFGGREVLEQVSRLDVDGRPLGLLRAAIDLTAVRREERALAWNIALHMLLLLGTLAASTALLIASRRLVATQAAWLGARREVAALEQERQRRERAVAMGELASGVAHEVRNPLNAIHVIAQRLGREFVPQTGGEEYTRLTGAVRQEVGRINGIVEQFLRFARPPQPRWQEADVAAVAREVAEVVRARFDAKVVRLAVSADRAVMARTDSDLLRQALHNLLDNALAACEAGASVEVTVVGTATGGARIVVADSGCGIPAEQLGRIFNLYHTTKPQGTGIGLALVDQIVALHDGKIAVASEVGAGTRFTIDLPPPREETP